MAEPEQDDCPAIWLRDWALSGAMALTGRREGPPLAAPGRSATLARQELTRLAAAVQKRTDRRPELPTTSVLSERAAISGLSRRGPWSCGGSFRALPTADGWVGLSLARPPDLELVPALVEEEVLDPWRSVAGWALSVTTSEAVARIELLGLPGAAVPVGAAPASSRAPVESRTIGRRRRLPERPLVIDLTSLWAGPLCGHLVGLGGADVVKVESITRPDGARLGPAQFYDLLHAGHRAVALDFASEAGREALLDLMSRADLVLEASRPRALAHLGIVAEDVVASGTSWLSITARGRDSNTVGFGDDVAVGAGLFVMDRGEVLPCGDAIADPLTGVVAGRAAAESFLSLDARLIDVSMHDVCLSAAVPSPATSWSRTAQVAAVPDERGGWQVDTGAEWVTVATPMARQPLTHAAPLGMHSPRDVA